LDIGRQLASLDAALALERLGGDQTLLSEIAGMFLEDYPRQLAAIREAVRSRDAQALHHAAHALKGSVSYCALAVVDAARRLEQMGRRGELGNVDDAFANLEAELARLEPDLAALRS